MRLRHASRAAAIAIAALTLSGCLYPRPEPEPPGPPAPPPPPPPTLDPRIARVDLHVSVQSIEGEAARTRCVDEVIRALTRHGFVVGPQGARVDVVLSLSPELDPQPYLDNAVNHAPRYDLPPPRPAPEAHTAHLSAMVRTNGQSLRAASTGASPCGSAGDRFADVLLASLTGH